jgi:hypothetical protein
LLFSLTTVTKLLIDFPIFFLTLIRWNDIKDFFSVPISIQFETQPSSSSSPFIVMCTHSVWKHVKHYNQLSLTMIKTNHQCDIIQKAAMRKMKLRTGSGSEWEVHFHSEDINLSRSRGLNIKINTNYPPRVWLRPSFYRILQQLRGKFDTQTMMFQTTAKLCNYWKLNCWTWCITDTRTMPAPLTLTLALFAHYLNK